MINLVVPTLIVSVLALVVSLAALAMVIGMKLSTHKIEWKPLITSDLREEEKYKDEEEETSEMLKEVLELSAKAKKKKVTDPLDEILETNNF
jgi:hypothetical protein